MKYFLIVVTFFAMTEAGRFNFKIHKTSAKPISDVTFELFERHQIEYDVIKLGRPSRTLSDTLNQMGKYEKNITKLYQVKDLIDWSGKNMTKNWNEKAAIVYAGSFPLLEKLVNEYNNTNTKLLIFVPKFIKFNFSNFSTSNHNSSNFYLFETQKKFELKILTRWTEESCDKMKFLSLNSFDVKSQKWEKRLKIPKINLNFHGCPLKISSHIFRLPTFDIIHESGMASYIHPGVDIMLKRRSLRDREISKIYAEFGNFTPIYRNRFDPDLDVEHLGINSYFNKLRCSNVFYQFSIVMMYSPADPYTNYEKMILPFDDLTWTYLLCVFVSAFVGIFLINLTPTYFRDLVFGRDVKMPTFNVIGTLFGIGQTKLPDNNFGRIILMTFILFCLIFRTAYQGITVDELL